MGLIKFIRDLWGITHLNIDQKINIPYGVSDIDDIYKKVNENDFILYK